MQSPNDPHGRLAVRPAEFRLPAWRDIATRVWHEVGDDRVMLLAAGAAFYVLLALVPALASTVALYGLVFDRSSVAEQMDALTGFMPYEARSLIGDQLKRLTDEPARALGATLAGTLALSLWSASAATKGLMDGLNVVYDESEQRSFFRYTATALIMTACGILAAAATIAVTVFTPILLKDSLRLPVSAGVISGLSYALLFAVLWVGLLVLYRWAPDRTQAKWRWLTPGTLVAAVLIVVFSAGFSWFARTFASYATAYGSLGAVIGFMTWIWVCIIIVLLGAEINAEMEHQTARDSTVGHEKPLGSRGATMADNIGATAEVTAVLAEQRGRPDLSVAATPAKSASPLPQIALLIGAAALGALVARL